VYDDDSKEVLMADNYIDYFEVSEYGRYFIRESEKLVGVSPMVDISAVRERVDAAVQVVENELKKASVQRNDLRDDREGSTGAAAELQDTIERFYYYLRSLPKTHKFNFEAFFPGRNMGALARLKPADLGAKADVVLHGFDSASNADLPGATDWKNELAAARATLSAAIASKGGAAGGAVSATAGLQAAREDFLRIYNRVTKRIVRALLIDLGRESEYRRFFLDLQVSEGGTRSTAGEPDSPDAGEADAGE
jgi:hypothetical protein